MQLELSQLHTHETQPHATWHSRTHFSKKIVSSRSEDKLIFHTIREWTTINFFTLFDWLKVRGNAVDGLLCGRVGQNSVGARGEFLSECMVSMAISITEQKPTRRYAEGAHICNVKNPAEVSMEESRQEHIITANKQ